MSSGSNVGLEGWQNRGSGRLVIVANPLNPFSILRNNADGVDEQLRYFAYLRAGSMLQKNAKI